MNPNRYLRVGSWLSVAAWAILIWILSSLPGPEVAKLDVFEIWDKAAHFIAFGAGATALALALRFNTVWRWPKIALLSALAISIFGAIDEWHQLYTPKRSGADPWDWLADILGASAAVLITAFFYARSQRKNCPPQAGA